jgi:acyl carrier protein
MSNLEEKLKELLTRETGVPLVGIPKNATLSSLGIDSLGYLEFLFAVEDEFGIKIEQNAADIPVTWEDVVTKMVSYGLK